VVLSWGYCSGEANKGKESSSCPLSILPIWLILEHDHLRKGPTMNSAEEDHFCHDEILNGTNPAADKRLLEAIEAAPDPIAVLAQAQADHEAEMDG